jgi:sec-independent protein translocase protein TatB
VFDIGWTELAVIACVAILVVGPKELPGMLRTIGKTVGQLRKMAGDFQKQFDEAVREAELDEVKKTMKAPFQPLEDARKAALDFQGSVNKSINEIGKDASAGMPSGSVTSGAAAGETAPVPAAFTAPMPTPVMPKQEALTAPAVDAGIAAKPVRKVPAKTAAKAAAPAKASSKPVVVKTSAQKTGAGVKTAVPAPEKAAAAGSAKAGTKDAPAAGKASAAKAKPGKKA